MSLDKAKLKNDVLRRPPYSSAILEEADADRAIRSGTFVPSASDALPRIRAIVEDSSVRFVAFMIAIERSPDPSYAHDLLRHFSRAADDVFRAFPQCRTYIFSFDKYDYVPARKRAVQRKRDYAANTQATRNDLEPDAWQWDGHSPIASVYSLQLPPWSSLGSQRNARGHITGELVSLLCQYYHAPAGCRLVLDAPGHAAPWIVETSPQGVHLKAYCAEALANQIGEGDISCQSYARHIMRTGLSLHADERFQNTLEALDISPDDALFRSSSPEPVAPKYSPNEYEAGSVVIRTSDIDLVVLALLHRSNEATPRPHNVYVSLANPVHRDANSPAYVTKTALGARPFYESYDTAALFDIITRQARVGERDQYGELLAIASFATFCFACGNDYVARRKRISHKLMHDAFIEYCTRKTLRDEDEEANDEAESSEEHSLDDEMPEKRRRLSRSLVVFGQFDDDRARRADALRDARARIDERRFRVFLKDVYRLRTAGSRGAVLPAGMSWERLAERISSTSKVQDNCMPSDEAFSELLESIQWYLDYALSHVDSVPARP